MLEQIEFLRISAVERQFYDPRETRPANAQEITVDSEITPQKPVMSLAREDRRFL
jgi:hypothetical protein